ncbi:hypothetical protein D3C85_1178450 [compost metagenome]
MQVEQRPQRASVQRDVPALGPVARPPQDQAGDQEEQIGERDPGQDGLAGALQVQRAVQLEQHVRGSFRLAAPALLRACRRIQEQCPAPAAAHADLQGFTRIADGPEHEVRAGAEFPPDRPQHGLQRHTRLRGGPAGTGHEQFRIRPAVQRRREDQRRAGQPGEYQHPARAERQPAVQPQP